MPMGFNDNPTNILGADTSNNQFASTNVTANADGSIIERQEYLQTLVAALSTGDVLIKGVADAGTSSTTEVAIAGLAGYGDDFFNNQFYMQVLKNANSAGNAPEKQVRQITDYVSTTGTFTMTAFGATVEASDICLILHESQVVLGRDDSNNTFDSSNVAANVDGSVLERLEDLKDRVNTIDDYIDTEIAAIKAVTDALPNAGALTTIDANVDAILDRVSGVDSVTNVMGANDNDNGFDSSNVAANVDGSILERLEDLKDRVDTVDNYIDSAALEKLTATADGGTNAYPDSVAQESVFAYILSKSANPVTTSYDNTTDSLEAISDKVTAVDDYIDGANLEKLTGAADGGTNAYPDSVVQESVFAYLMSKSADPVVTSYNNTTDSLEAISDKITTLTGYVDTEVAAIQTDIGDPSTRVNFQSIEAMLGMPDAANSCLDDIVRTGFDSTAITANADGSIMEREEAIKDQITNFAAAGGDGSAIVRKTVTFSNTNADVNLFTVTGGVTYKLMAFCTTNVESAGGCNIGVDHNSAVVIADTDCTTLEANDVWHDATPDSAIELESVFAKRVAYGGTIALDVETAKQVDSGVIVFVCIYNPITSNGAVAAA